MLYSLHQNLTYFLKNISDYVIHKFEFHKEKKNVTHYELKKIVSYTRVCYTVAHSIKNSKIKFTRNAHLSNH
jgi:hypothetical protein